ncbi:MAG: hypothetical protein QOJ42_1305, partial [Acidobacteriaceae bacterium]|nr:hypothetical protein [Acidobacteriaceae bacterium]
MPPTLRNRIDDNIPNLKAFIGQGILFTAPHKAL